MTGRSNERPGADAGWRVLFAFESPRSRAAQAERLPARLPANVRVSRRLSCTSGGDSPPLQVNGA